MRKTHRLLAEMGFYIEHSAGKMIVSAPIAATGKFLDQWREFSQSCTRENRGTLVETLDSENIEFSGGTTGQLVRDLNGHIDMAPFLAAKSRIERSGLLDRLQCGIAEVSPRRRRVFSEHDGDWDLDRRYEIQPFQNTIKAHGHGRMIDIVCNFSIRATSSVESINQYGAMVWAIATAIEQAGIPSRIITQTRVNGVNEKAWESHFDFLVKDHTEFIEPSFMAAIFQARFYRLLNFAIRVAASDAIGATAEPGMGASIQASRSIEFSDGVLAIAPNVTDAFSADVEREILKAIGVTQPIPA